MLCQHTVHDTADLVIHACAIQSFLLQLKRVCKLYYPYAACNVWRAVIPSSKLKFPKNAQLFLFSESHLTAMFRLSSHSHCSIAFEGMEIFSGKYFVCLFFFLPFYCFVLILGLSKTWNKKQRKITHRCRMQTLELSACKVSFKNCEWKSGTRLASVHRLNKSGYNDCTCCTLWVDL